MKRGLRLLLVVLLVMAAVSGAAFAAPVQAVTLELDGSIVETEAPPTIIQGRTVVPAKFLFEAMGGTVDWLPESRQVKVMLNGTSVVLSIDSTTAFVNGVTEEMEVPATIISSRTFIPVAFVAEKLGCTVNWVEATRTVQITSPQLPEKTQIIDVDIEEDDSRYRISVTADAEIINYKSFVYDAPERFILDIVDTELDMEIDGEEGSIDVAGNQLSKVRFAQFDKTTVRVVADLKEKTAGKVSLSEDKHVVYIDFEKKTGNTGDSGSVDLGAMDIPALDWRAQSKLIIIDPGHGGTDSGSLGYDGNRNIIQMEKDLNIAIALRLNELLKAAGANTHILRESDQSIALYERPAIANSLHGDLYVSVHNNSNESAAPNGTETHYYNKSTDASYGYTSKSIAESVQKEIVKSVGLKDRGAKSSPLLAVLNKTEMPAIIIEGAFLSNSTELAYMMTTEFQEAYAVGAARGIINALNASVTNN